uniref:Retrotransposon gag domain-containing protein n=1 Tax=Fagus sylvatica TaxID=28930 RepID=A0A2N9HVG4_FAGSY
MMSHRSDSSPKGMADNSSFVLQAMQQQFERLSFVLGEVRDRMDHQEAAIRNLQEHRRVRHERGLEGNLGGRDGVDRDLGSIKMKIPSFQGRTDLEVYLEWEKKIELVFDCHNYSEEKKVKLVVIEFTDYVIIWWNQLVTNRRRNYERPVETWGELKALMRRRFVPSHYYRDLYQKLQNLTQGSRSVEDYHKEMEVAMIRANHYVEIEDMVHMTMKVERQLKRKGIARYTSVSSTTWKSKWDMNDPAEAKRKTEPPKGKDEGTSNKPKVESQLSRNRDIKYFKCLGSGHIASQCPNRRVMIMRDNEEVMTESEDDSDGVPELVDASDDDGVVYPVTSESLVARRALNTHIKVDDAEQQRENIFHTRCHVNNKVCSMIIDGGSCTNVASTTLIEKLNLPTLKHSRPYKLQWLNDCGEVRVDRQVLVTFSIGKYLDEEFEDVFPEEMPNELPPIRGIEHQIDFVPEAAIPNRPTYRSNLEETKELQRQIEDLMSKGYVRESMSPCAVPVLLVPKKDGTWRMCVDYRAINNITVKYRHPIPRLDDMLDELHGSCKFVVVYFDDILVYSKDLNEHIEHLRYVFDVLRCEKFTKGIEVDEEKVKAIKEWPTPKSITEDRWPIAFFSEKLSGASLKEFVIHIDHESLKHLKGQGKENIVADALSRRYVLLTSMSAKMLGFEYVKDMYADDADFSDVYKACDKASFDLMPLPVDGRSSLDGQKKAELVKSLHERVRPSNCPKE